MKFQENIREQEIENSLNIIKHNFKCTNLLMDTWYYLNNKEEHILLKNNVNLKSLINETIVNLKLSNKNQIKKIIDEIFKTKKLDYEFSDPFFTNKIKNITFKNGIYDLDTHEFKNLPLTEFSINCNYDFNHTENQHVKNFETHFKNIFGYEKHILLPMISILLNENNFGKIILYNGNTLFEVLSKIFGKLYQEIIINKDNQEININFQSKIVVIKFDHIDINFKTIEKILYESDKILFNKNFIISTNYPLFIPLEYKNIWNNVIVIKSHETGKKFGQVYYNLLISTILQYCQNNKINSQNIPFTIKKNLYYYKKLSEESNIIEDFIQYVDNEMDLYEKYKIWFYDKFKHKTNFSKNNFNELLNKICN